MRFFNGTLMILIFTSCVSTKKLENIEPKENVFVPFENGTYSNCHASSIDTCDYEYSLVEQISHSLSRKDTLANWNELSIELIKKEKSLVINILDGDSLIKNFALKGSWKKNAFYSKRVIRPIGVPLIYYWYYEKKIIIKCTKDELIIMNGENWAGMIFVASAGSTDYTWNKYEKLLPTKPKLH